MGWKDPELEGASVAKYEGAGVPGAWLRGARGSYPGGNESPLRVAQARARCRSKLFNEETVAPLKRQGRASMSCFQIVVQGEVK
jgi:hypothetical protein